MKTLLSAVVVVSIAASSFAALSKEYANFPKGPAQFLMTKAEVAEWKNVQTDEQAKAFIDLFWARRDPTPGTPKNEFRDSFDKRVKLADERFHSPKVPGSMTDRGKVFAALGGPSRLRKSTAAPVSTIQAPFNARTTDTSTPVQAYSPKEIWEYEQSKIDIKLGQPMVEVVFIDQYGTDDWKIERQPKSDISAIFESVAKSYIAQPDIREVPAVIAEVTVPMAETVLALKSDTLRAAVDAARAAKTSSSNLFVSYGEFITPEGVGFVPIQLYAPAAAGIEAGAAVTYFGSIEKPTGEIVAVFEDPATMTQTNGGVYVARSVALVPGEYRGIVGIAREGKPVSVVSSPIKVAGLAKDAPTVSSLILSNHIYTLTEAQSPTDPFSFGGMRVVPKSDMTFKSSDELSYFFELRNPALDATTKQPKISVKLTVTGKTKDGQPVKMAAPAEETPAQELKGVPGHWAIGQAMPLSTFKPGDYTLAVKVTDMTANRSYDLQGQFRIVE